MPAAQLKSRRSLLARTLFAPPLWLGLALIAWLLWQGRASQEPVKTTSLSQQRPAPPGMILVPGGECWLGTDDADADDDVRPMRRVFVPSFTIDVHEVTNAEFRLYKSSHTFAPGQENLPVTNVTYDQAEAYAKWAGKRLPTEAEWEKAARGTDGRRYPWGNTWNSRLVAPRAHTARANASPPVPAGSRVCYLGPQRVQPVGSVSGGISPYGCYDMAGNAWEWVQGYYNGNPEQRILRGGAVGYGERACRTYSRAIEGSGDT